ncbi:hypothetical protein GCM10027454_33910 [Algoriphagus aestuariicola]
MALAAFAALAFTSPEANNLYGEENGTWYDVTSTTPNNDTYVCDQVDEDGCLYDAPHGMGSPIEDSSRGKKFIVQNEDNLVVAP